MFKPSFSTISRSIALTPKRMSSKIVPVFSSRAPPPAAPYSPAVKVNGFIYVSGQIPRTADNKALPGQPTMAQQAELVIENVSNLLQEANSSLKHVVKANVFLTDMNDFAEFNSVYGKYFNEHKPARSCVAVKELPLGVPVEMEVIAIEKEEDSKL